MKLLKVDVDFHPPKEWLNEWINTRIRMLPPIEYYKIFFGKRGFHVYFKLYKDVSGEDANRLQFLLGDDATRVKINQWRIKRGIKHWNKLFHKVLYRRKAKVLTCFYCGNKIPVPDKWFEKVKNINSSIKNGQHKNNIKKTN